MNQIPVDNKKVLLHTFITANYIGWAELFLESFRYHHGEHVRIRIDGFDLSEEDIALLSRIYTNIEIQSTNVDWNQVALDLGVDDRKLERWRGEISRGMVDDENYRVKLYLSVSQRYRNMENLVNDAARRGYSALIHSDADVYFRRPLDSLLNIVSQNDLALFLRPKKKRHSMRVWGGFLGFNLEANAKTFLDRWMQQIDSVPAAERWKGFGQSAIWFTVQESEDLKIADLSTLPEAPRYSKTTEDDAHIWIGNSSVGHGPTKIITRRLFWEDLKRGYPRVPVPRVSIRDHWIAFVQMVEAAVHHKLSRLKRSAGARKH